MDAGPHATLEIALFPHIVQTCLQNHSLSLSPTSLVPVPYFIIQVNTRLLLIYQTRGMRLLNTQGPEVHMVMECAERFKAHSETYKVKLHYKVVKRRDKANSEHESQNKSVLTSTKVTQSGKLCVRQCLSSLIQKLSVPRAQCCVCTQTPPPAPAMLASIKASIYSRPSIALSDEEARRSEVAVQQFAGFGDPSGIGAKLLSKMGFGAAEGSKGGLGRNEQVSHQALSHTCHKHTRMVSCAVITRQSLLAI